MVVNTSEENTVLGGEFYPKDKLTLNNSTIDGKFSVKDFEATGNCTFRQKTNTVSKITGNNNTWVLDDMPELTVTLSTDDADTSNYDSGRCFGHFDSTFKVVDLSVYSWNYDSEAPLTYTNKNNAVQIKVKNGQGVSDDGMTFTFTICYPAVTRLEQSIEIDTSERTSNCKDILEPRTVSAVGAISYKSSNPEIASVDSVTGKITAHKKGAVIITVKAAKPICIKKRR